MTKIGTRYIYLTGSHKFIQRVVFIDDNKKAFCKFYGNMIEVEVSKSGYYNTVEAY